MHRTRFANPGWKPFPIGPRDDRRWDPFWEPSQEESFQYGSRPFRRSHILSLTQYNSLDVGHDLQTGTESHVPTRSHMDLGEAVPEDPSQLRPRDKGSSNRPSHAGPPCQPNSVAFP